MKSALRTTFYFIALIITAAHLSHAASNPSRPILVAHRGANMEADENTLKAYSLAADYGMDFIECDPRLTKNGAFIIMHDADVSRTTDGKGNIPEMTLKEIESLKTRRGESVPTLEEVFALAKKKGVNVYLDTKQFTPDYMEKLTAAVITSEMADRVVIGLWTLEQLKWMRQNRPGIAVSIPYPTPMSNLKSAKKLGASWIGTVLEQATPSVISKAESLGLKVITFPINDEETIVREIKAGMQVIQTDDPKLLQSVIRRIELGK